jgi:microcystin-dependent protein
LFSVVSTMYGVGNGTSTFNVPDMRGIFVSGSGSQTINGTAYTKTLGQKQNHNLENHKHTYKDAHYYEGNVGTETILSSVDYRTGTGDSQGVISDESLTNRLTTGTYLSTATQTNTYTPPTTGVLLGTETYPANIAVNYIIKT